METKKETETKPERIKGKGKNPNSLKNLQMFNTENASENGKKGIVKSHEARKKNKDMREAAKALLDVIINENKARELLDNDTDIANGKMSVMELLNAKMYQEAMQGSVKAYEALRDTAGYKPTTEINLDAEIITEKDKQLLDALTKPEKN